jgi:hypothetical protein
VHKQFEDQYNCYFHDYKKKYRSIIEPYQRRQIQRKTRRDKRKEQELSNDIGYKLRSCSSNSREKKKKNTNTNPFSSKEDLDSDNISDDRNSYEWELDELEQFNLHQSEIEKHEAEQKEKEMVINKEE